MIRDQYTTSNTANVAPNDGNHKYSVSTSNDLYQNVLKNMQNNERSKRVNYANKINREAKNIYDPPIT